MRHLDRQTLENTARGRCPKDRLSTVREHLAICSRCRAAVVGLASGRPVTLGDTVDGAPDPVGRARKAAPVAVALALSGLMLWGPPPSTPPVVPFEASYAPMKEHALPTVPTTEAMKAAAPEAPAAPLPAVLPCPPQPALTPALPALPVRPRPERVPDLPSGTPAVAMIDGRRIRVSL